MLFRSLEFLSGTGWLAGVQGWYLFSLEESTRVRSFLTVSSVDTLQYNRSMACLEWIAYILGAFVDVLSFELVVVSPTALSVFWSCFAKEPLSSASLSTLDLSVQRVVAGISPSDGHQRLAVPG